MVGGHGEGETQPLASVASRELAEVGGVGLQSSRPKMRGREGEKKPRKIKQKRAIMLRNILRKI